MAFLSSPDLLPALNEISCHPMDGCPQGAELGVITASIQPNVSICRLSLEQGRRLESEMGMILKRLLRSGDSLFALGRGEWLIVLPALPSRAVLTLAMLKIEQVFGESPFQFNGLELPIQFICGAAVSPEHGEDPLYLVQSARIAALDAQQRGERGAMYDKSMERTSPRLAILERDLHGAFGGERPLQLFLQPKVHAIDGECDAAEGLLRWERVPGEWVPPPVVLGLIDRLGMRHRFNRWLFQHAAQALARLDAEGFDITLSINLSATDLYDAEVPDLIGQALSTWGMPPRRLCLEITETDMVDDAGEGVADVLCRLRLLGVKLSIDDFGTGFSGMSRLKHLSVQEVKIDRSFVVDLLRSERDREIASSIIDLSHRLGVTVTAEGVEDAETAAALAALGCNHLQGFHFSPALALDDFVVWLGRYDASRGPSS
ncbi:GGDEF domain-containing phosphodiesterase [Thauera sp. Sel9]|uniref:GGDEF domain-containing phosphodiesterase n=1 Tax=Thauera sp. Sel9 TaxID=2974299 RepID=UPI0021E11BFE|nr:GGDEF domain-containing phosphodiesterase [Thauera sp. Sel9]MCV2215842.1 EAL domain-containing protein [Thauera sp. Sel9]